MNRETKQNSRKYLVTAFIYSSINSQSFFNLLTDIPVVLCYVSVIDKCLRHVFELEEVATAVEQVKDIIQRHSAEISSKVAELPAYNEHFPWTLYELLKFFAESISWSEDMDQLVITAKTVTEALSALVVSVHDIELPVKHTDNDPIDPLDCIGHIAWRGYATVQHVVADHIKDIDQETGHC